jgi:hypothetical protein
MRASGGGGIAAAPRQMRERSESPERLVISPRTAGKHVEHIYTKIDASSRAAAGLFAMQHGLLPEELVSTAAPVRA